MVRPVIHDPLFLAQPSSDAVPADRQTALDLMDTLRAHADECVGMAANMIGVSKRILAFAAGPFPVVMINPVVVRRSGPYEAEEGCLSLPGTKKTTRYARIEVKYLDLDFRPRKQSFSDFTAQIIQHEMDHFEGILI